MVLVRIVGKSRHGRSFAVFRTRIDRLLIALENVSILRYPKVFNGRQKP